MRVTQSYSTKSLLRQINNTRERISTTQRDLASGKRLNQISDDPENIEAALRFRMMLKYNTQFEKNINNATEFLTFASNALNDSADIISNIKELTIQGIDSTNNEEMDAIARQLDELVQELVDAGNTRFKGRYVFGGANVTSPPFTIAADLSAVTVNPEGIDGDLEAELGQGNIDQYNITGQDAFLGNVDTFQTIIDLRDAFVNRDTTAINNLIPDIESALDQTLEANTRAGAKINRYESLLSQYQDEDLKLNEFLSDIEDTNFPEAILQLQGDQTALETALRALSRTVNVSLVDFI